MNINSEFILFKENNFWGLKLTKHKIILPSIYNEVSVFVFENGQLIKKISSLDSKVSSEGIFIYSFDKAKTIILLVRKFREYFLLQVEFNLFQKEFGITNIFKEYETSESFQLSPLRNKPIKILDDYVYFGKYYSDIIDIGKGFFKVKIIKIQKVYEPINEDDFTWRYYFDDISWEIIDFKGIVISNDLFQEVDEFKNNLCKVKKNGKWNFLNEKGTICLQEWFDYLDYPFINDEDFLAGKTSYIINLALESRSRLFYKGDLSLNIRIKYDHSFISESFFQNKYKNTPISENEIKELLEGLFGKLVSIDIDDYCNLDLYNKNGIVKRMGIKNLQRLNEDLLIAEVNSPFICTYSNDENNINIFRFNEKLQVIEGDHSFFKLTQKRLIDTSGDFINNEFYYEIDTNVKTNYYKVSKSFFQIYGDESVQLVDASFNSLSTKGTVEYWTEKDGYDESGILNKAPIVKYGAIDLKGNEIVECMFESYEVDSLIKNSKM